LGAGGDREAILAVMKDSRVGVFGVTALILAIGLKASLLTALPADRYVLIAGVAGAVSRASAVTMMKVFPPAGSIGLAATLSPALSNPVVALTALIGVGAAASLGWPGAAGALLGWASGLLVALWSWRLIGGVTGDTLGAIVVVSELGVLALG
jgi:adenosylcobinamide-GDP ribazoletransferase